MNEENKEQKEQKSFLQKVLAFIPPLTILGVFVGVLGGYIYYLKVGCVDGTCAITSNPWMSTLWGGLMGYLIFDMFNRKSKTKKKS